MDDFKELSDCPVGEKVDQFGKVPDCRVKTNTQRQNSPLGKEELLFPNLCDKVHRPPYKAVSPASLQKEFGCPWGGPYTKWSITKIPSNYMSLCFLLPQILTCHSFPLHFCPSRAQNLHNLAKKQCTMSPKALGRELDTSYLAILSPATLRGREEVLLKKVEEEIGIERKAISVQIGRL